MRGKQKADAEILKSFPRPGGAAEAPGQQEAVLKLKKQVLSSVDWRQRPSLQDRPNVVYR